MIYRASSYQWYLGNHIEVIRPKPVLIPESRQLLARLPDSASVVVFSVSFSQLPLDDCFSLAGFVPFGWWY